MTRTFDLVVNGCKSVETANAFDELVVVTVDVSVHTVQEGNFVGSSSVVVGDNSSGLPAAQACATLNKLTKVEA